MLYFVVKRDGVTDDYSYCGAPCTSEEEAREIIWDRTYNLAHSGFFHLEEPVKKCIQVIHDDGAILETYSIFVAGRED